MGIKTKLPMIILLIILWLGLSNINSAWAGTSQIFSPAGLPRSSSQDYSIPDTTVTPQTFPTPPIPMGETSLQGFSSVPLKEELTTNGTAPVPKTTNGQISQPQSASSSVESFFQYTPLANRADLISANKNKPANSLGKVIWHTLDNIGVPLPVSKNGDLDPSLSKSYITPIPQAPNQTNSKPIHQKIPDSELGVTDIPQQDDAKLH